MIVSHHANGIDVLHLFSGAKVCDMALVAGALHVDLDGDGVVDRVEAHDWKTRGPNIPRCWATVHSGVNGAVEERTLSASICRGGSGINGHRAALAAGHDIRTVEVAPPTSLRRLPETANEISKPLDRMGRDAIFLNNRGEMTCYNMRDGGTRRWQIRTSADWTPDGFAKPSLSSLSMRVGGYLDLAVAVGARSIVIVNSKGYRASPDIELTTPPRAPLEIRDVDGDGLNDLVLRTQFSVYIWVQRPHAGNLPFTFLIGCLTCTMATAFAYQVSNATSASSTSRGASRFVVLRSTMLDGDEIHTDKDDDTSSSDDDDASSSGGSR